jgi:hypothetical protein
MNQLLQQLKAQAEFVGDRYALHDEFAEKFAELIVAECVEQVLTGVRTNPPHAHPPELIRNLARRIEQHFGVAE